MTYDYYLQQGKDASLRRYTPGEQEGERWDRQHKAWTYQCAPRLSCLLTKDKKLTETEALAHINFRQ
jgi:hypothetical protein